MATRIRNLNAGETYTASLAFIGNRQLYLPVMLQGAGCRMNDSMGAYVASEVFKLMIKKGTPVKGILDNSFIDGRL